MLGWLLFGALLTVAVISITVVYLNKDIAEQELKKQNISKGVIKDIIKSGNVTHIKLDAIKEDGNEVEVDIESEDYNSSQIYRGVIIYT